MFTAIFEGKTNVSYSSDHGWSTTETAINFHVIERLKRMFVEKFSFHLFFNRGKDLTQLRRLEWTYPKKIWEQVLRKCQSAGNREAGQQEVDLQRFVPFV